MHFPQSRELLRGRCRRALVELVVVRGCHVIQAVDTGHREGEHAHAFRILAQVDAADQQIVVDHLENVVEA